MSLTWPSLLYLLLGEKGGLFFSPSELERVCCTRLPWASGRMLSLPRHLSQKTDDLFDRSSESLAASSFSTFSPFQTPFLLLAGSQDTINLKTKKTELDRKQNPDSLGSETSLKAKAFTGSVFQWGLGKTNIVFKKKPLKSISHIQVSE